MNFYYLLMIFILFFETFKLSCQDPITISLAIGSMVTAYLFRDNVKSVVKKIGQKIGYYEGCEDFWITDNIEGLRYDLSKNLYGQPLATQMVLDALSKHLQDKYSSTPLVLSFHGDPGTGKSYVSKMILKHMFRKGKDTEYVHFFRASIDFPSQNEVYKYREQVLKIIKDKIYECHRSVFVFDEVDKMPSGVLDVLTGIINQGKSGDYDYRRAIFILISNIGGKALLEESLKSYAEGQDREYMDKKHLSELIAKEAYNSKGGLGNSALISYVKVSNYIPFLPLERDHIIQCLEKEVKKHDQIVSQHLTRQVLQELLFIPDDNPIYAEGGCKIMPEKVHFFITRQQRRNRKSIFKIN